MKPAAVALLLLSLSGCGQRAASNELSERGRSVYMTNCVVCHNPDPKKDGNVGPALAGSSIELLRMRVPTASYPPGYTPKRPTKLMQAFPHLVGEVDALHAFLSP